MKWRQSKTLGLNEVKIDKLMREYNKQRPSFIKSNPRMEALLKIITAVSEQHNKE